MAKTRFTESTTPTEAVAGQHVLRIRAAAYPRGDAQDDLLMDELKVRRIPAGFVMLFTSDFLPIEPANEFLLAKCALGKGSRWLNTQESYADDLAQLWSFLLVNNIPWDNVTAADLDAYAEVLGSAISPTTSRKYAKQTVARRVGTAERFRDWLSTRGYAPLLDKVALAEKSHVAAERLLLPHLGTVANETQDRRPRKNSKSAHVAFISNNDLIRIFSHLGPSPYANHENDLRPIRDRVVAELSLYSGMRVDEITSLTLYQILNLLTQVDESDPFKPLSLRITETKGGEPRPVIVPSFVVKALGTYIDDERTPVVEYVSEKLGRSCSHALFLNGEGANHRDIGRKLSASSASRAFRLAVRAAGLTRIETVFSVDPATCEPIYNDIGEIVLEGVHVAKHSFHDLRYTFACQFFASHLRAGHPEPWKKLQARLGHTSVKTTMDIYLAHFEVSEPEISDLFSMVLAEQLNALG